VRGRESSYEKERGAVDRINGSWQQISVESAIPGLSWASSEVSFLRDTGGVQRKTSKGMK
jgi:hypothetical protein